MVQLILIVMAIALGSAMLLASVHYLPSWQGQAEVSYALAKSGFHQFEYSYKAYTKANSGVPPTPTADPDGGLALYFQSYYSFLPKAPKGYTWKYGTNGINDYFCLYPLSTGAEEGIYRGVRRAQQVFSDEQFFMATGGILSCGATTNMTEPSAFPVDMAATYLVRYVAEMP